MRVKRLRWAGNVIRMFDKGMPKRILKGNVGGRRPTGKPWNRWEDEVRKDAAKLLSMKNWFPTTRHRSDWWKKTGETMARKRAEELQVEELCCLRAISNHLRSVCP
jgi:hypothetical protein